MSAFEQTRADTTMVQRAAHVSWAALIMQYPKAGALLHVLAARVDEHNAVIASHKVLARFAGCSVSTIKRAISVLVTGNWIEVRQIGDRGTVNAYVVNDRVVWHGPRPSERGVTEG
jgi:hypothetical protein